MCHYRESGSLLHDSHHKVWHDATHQVSFFFFHSKSTVLILRPKCQTLCIVKTYIQKYSHKICGIIIKIRRNYHNMKKKSYFFHRNIGRTHKKDQNKQSYEILRDLRFIGILHIIYWSDPYDPGVDKPEQVHFKKVSSAMFL